MPVNFFIVSLGFVLALIAWFVALCGCCSSIKKYKYCLVTLGIFSWLIMILFWALGAVFIVQGTYGGDYVNDRCTKLESAGKVDGMDGSVFESVSTLDASLVEVTNYMCTDRCPCFYNKGAFEHYLAIEEEQYNKFKRTKANMCVNSEEYVKL